MPRAGHYSDCSCRLCLLAARDPDDRLLNTGAARLDPRPAPVVPPVGGPGTELKAILDSLDIQPHKGCACGDKVREMDAWGVDGCRLRREQIVQWLSESRAKLGWGGRLKAAFTAVGSGLALELNPVDPLGSLVDLAIRRAEEKF